MNSLAVTLILAAAVIHATWNLMAKKAGGGATFVWLFTMVSCVVYAPLGLWIVFMQQPHVGAVGWFFIFGSAVLRLLYFLMLQGGYRTGDLSLVYPLARGTGPTLATLAAIVILQERPSALVLLGAAFVIFGVILISLGPSESHASHRRAAITYGFLCGLFIASYSVWDKVAVSTHGAAIHTLDVPVPPLMLQVFSNLGISILMTPYAVRNWQQVQADWTTHRETAIGIAILYPAAYTLVLWAMSFTDLSYIASAREISILFGALLGTQLLGEGFTRRRLIAASTMVLGVILLASS